MELFFLLTLLVCASAKVKNIHPPLEITKSSAEYDEICKTALCVPKCCPHGSYIFTMWKRCVKLKVKSGQQDFKSVSVYDKNLTLVDSLEHYNVTWVPKMLADHKFNDSAFDISYLKLTINYYLTEEGMLYMELPNTYNRWSKFNRSQYCMDILIKILDIKKKKFNFSLSFLTTNHSPNTKNDNPISKYATIVSVFFLALLLVVYTILHELRNLSGKVLMAYVTSLMGAFLLLFVIQNGSHLEATVCKGLAYSTYYLFLASFCWMNIMSCDIWWTFRGYAKARPIHRRGENFKFGMYCIYAWGLPAALTVILIVLNELDLEHKPWIIKPNLLLRSRFIDGPEKVLYLYIPMMILIICNWVFFLMTAFNIWRLHRATAVLDSAAAGTPAAHRTQKYRFLVYLKLSVIMGINWLLEVASFFSANFKGWYISDIYNTLIGLSIFVIFVCKRQILRKLQKKLGGCRNWTQSRPWHSRSRSTNTTESDISTDHPVCINPRGPVFSLTQNEKLMKN